MGSGRLVERIAARTAQAGVAVDAAVSEALAVYVELLLRWNRGMNLTALADDDRGLDRLVVEPLVAAVRLPGEARAIVDIGSGAGSPAVPMKLAVPALRLRMVESKQKKGAFLREVVRELQLQNVVVESCRYEELLGRPELRMAADVVTVRAVRVEPRRLEGLLRVGGALFLFRGPGDVDERAEVRAPLRWRETLPLVESLGSRLVVVERR